jgi:hypothetical protein
MSNRARFAGVAFVTLLLAGCGVSEDTVGENLLKLPECSGRDTVFSALRLESASSVYHSTVSGVVNAHLAELADLAGKPLQCTANDYRGLLEPSRALSDLANRLPEWGPSRAAELSEADLGPVLLEYLRVYECALHERERFLTVFVQDEEEEVTETEDGKKIGTIGRLELTTEQERQRKLITDEILTARPALEKTLAFLGAIDRLRPLSAELECLKRASLDLRNATGLMAEASACMPKIWDARGSLRDLPDDEGQ